MERVLTQAGEDTYYHHARHHSKWEHRYCSRKHTTVAVALRGDFRGFIANIKFID